MTGSAERSPIQDPEHRAAVWNIAVQLYESARPPGSLLALVKEIEDALHNRACASPGRPVTQAAGAAAGPAGRRVS